MLLENTTAQVISHDGLSAGVTQEHMTSRRVF